MKSPPRREGFFLSSSPRRETCAAENNLKKTTLRNVIFEERYMGVRTNGFKCSCSLIGKQDSPILEFRSFLSMKTKESHMFRKQFMISPVLMLALLLMALSVVNCAGRMFSRPPGERIASCEGKMEMTTGGSRDFRIDVYRNGDNEHFAAYFSMPGRAVRYFPIEDISLDDGELSVETSSPHRTYHGEIVLDSLTFKGWWNEWSGIFTLNTDK